MNVNTFMESLEFIGTYETPQMNDQNVFTKNTKISVKDNDTVIFRGRFKQDIEKNVQVFFLIHYLRVNIKLNGQEIYTYGNNGSYPSIVKSGGKIWGRIDSKGITKEDEIEITLYNPYGLMNYTTVYEDFINSFCTGDTGNLLLISLRKDIGILLIGSVMLVIATALLILGVILSIKNLIALEPVLWCAFYTLVSGIWFILQTDTANLFFPYPVFIFIICTLCILLQLPLFIKYMSSLMTSKARILIQFTHRVSVIMVVIFIILQILGLLDAYQIRGYYIVIAAVLLTLVLFCMLYEVKQSKDSLSKSIMISVIIFILFGGIELANYRLEITKNTIFLFIGYIIFILSQIIVSIIQMEYVMTQSKRAAEMEKELMENNISIMLSQIQPHFLYNSISSIQMLCKKNPDMAQKALGEFAGFLRGNMDSLNSTKLIPFTKELRHVKAYLYLEKMRFGEMLQIEYDIRIKDFCVPPLTIQPIVENASKYGVGDKETGGTIFIGTREEKDAFVIIIADDGIGFDSKTIDKLDGDKKSHVGIKNVREHIEKQCRGRLSIDSKVGVGTTVTIRIPKGEIL